MTIGKAKEQKNIVDISKSAIIVDDFLYYDKELIKCFNELARYMYSLNSEIVLRYNGEIIGLATPESVYYLYLSCSDGQYYIKFKHMPIKEKFDIANLELYKKFCNGVVTILEKDPMYSLNTGVKATAVKEKQDVSEDAPRKKSQQTSPWKSIYCKSREILKQEDFSWQNSLQLRRKAEWFYREFLEIFEELILNNLKFEYKRKHIYADGIIEQESIKKIGKSYGLTVDEVMITLNWGVSVIKSKVRRATLPEESINRIFDLIDLEEYEHTVYSIAKLKEKNSLLWECISPIFISQSKEDDFNKLLLKGIESQQSFDSKDIDSNKEIKHKKYTDWVNEYPDYVVIMKKRYFYSSYYHSAEIISDMLGYRLTYSSKKNIPFTGGTNLVKIQETLKNNNINYIVVANNKVIDEFSDGKSITELKPDVDSNEKKIMHYIECLENDIDPETGEIIEDSGWMTSAEFKQIMRLAKKSIVK